MHFRKMHFQKNAFSKNAFLGKYQVRRSSVLHSACRGLSSPTWRTAAPDQGPGYRVVANFWQSFGKSSLVFWLYRHRSLQENTRSAAFFKIYQILKLKNSKFGKFCIFCSIKFCKCFTEFSRKSLIFQTDVLLKN